MDTPQKTRKGGIGDLRVAILSPANNVTLAAEKGQKFNKIQNFTNILSNREPKRSKLKYPPYIYHTHTHTHTHTHVYMGVF